MDIKNFKLGQNLNETLFFFTNYGNFLWRQGRTYTHTFARQVYNDVAPFLTEEELLTVREALLKLDEGGVDWISRGRFVGYLLYLQNELNNPTKFSQEVNIYSKKRLEFYSHSSRV
ncbi:MAG: hypothetical protein RSA48_03685 [Bacilli bacterium]